MAEARSGTATFVEGASPLCHGVQGLSPIRSKPNMRAGTRDQHGADSCATPPGTPSRLRIRGGAEVVALVRRARLSVCAHKTKRFLGAINYAEEET